MSISQQATLKERGQGGEVDNYTINLIWLYAQVYGIINYRLFKLQEKDVPMSDKPLPDLKTFIENVNKKDKPNGKKVRFGFTKRKRK